MADPRRLLPRLLALGLSACSARSSPDTSATASSSAPTPEQTRPEPAPSASSPAVPPATPAPGSASSPVASSSAPALASATASATASASALPKKTIPIPHEPSCGSGMCAEQMTCIKESGKPFEYAMPEPFERCAPALDIGGFSRRKTEQQRKATPGVCCYVSIRRPMRGRPLLLGGLDTEAPLVRRSWG